ncbi:MAG TPA: efflux RND transporter periplasmic adaptor subunit, partial [Armatimonadota bacterium]|nr:efflux RND transporter periplasmic adaptor subunit [Armatimonadota bacterium]
MSRGKIIAFLLIAVVFFGLLGMAKVRGIKKETKTTDQIHAEVGKPIQTSRIELGGIEDTIEVTGDITALQTVTLSPKISGKVSYVTVREGDIVRAGQVIVQLDRSDAEANLRQATAGLESAQARLSQARTSASVTEVQSTAGIRQAEAALAAAEANLQKIKKGARSQERMIAENQVATAKANLNNADANLKRYKQLYQQGAVAKAQLDVYQTQYDVALAQYNSAMQNLSLVEEGARTEDVRAAETQVTQAREGLRAAKANAAQNALRQEDIKNAMAGVSQAKAQVALAQEQLNNTVITSPIDGVVSKRMTEPGQMATPGMPLMEVVSLSTVFFQANVSETVLAKVKPGQPVHVKVDAYPGQTFVGKVEKLYPTASTGTRNFSVRIQVPNPESQLKPGMFASGSIVTGGSKAAVLVPQDAVEDRAGRSIVFTVEENKVKMHTITKGLSNTQFVEVLMPTELEAGDMVVTSGNEYLEDGDKVYMTNRGP